MVYEFVGKIISATERSGQSAKGPWKMWECTMQHDLGGQYPSYVAFEVWDEETGKNLETWKVTGANVKLSAYVNAREYNGRWFNSIRASRVEPIVQQMPQQQMAMPMQQQAIPYQGQQNPNAGGYAQQQGYGGAGVNPNTGLPF